MEHQNRINWEMITAICAIVTAIIALGLGIWDRVETRAENALLVRPRISLYTPIEVENGEKRRVLKIVNNGLGPADVRTIEFKIRKTGKNFPVSDTKQLFKEFNLNSSYFGRTSMATPIFFRQEESMVMIYFKYPDSSEEAYNIEASYMNMLCQLDFRVEYYSLYGEYFTNNWGPLLVEGCEN